MKHHKLAGFCNSEHWRTVRKEGVDSPCPNFLILHNGGPSATLALTVCDPLFMRSNHEIAPKIDSFII